LPSFDIKKEGKNKHGIAKIHVIATPEKKKKLNKEDLIICFDDSIIFFL
tara:strand:+ start:148 stop:294 length:147 start_codon:yes stop_codon:yes gene_type:complete